jgi:uncharacterized protein YlzI (FlbEa/FlbD family)
MSEINLDTIKEVIKLDDAERKILKSTVQKLIDDDDFINSLEDKLNEIVKDGKIDSKDIPMIMLVMMECTNNLDKFNLTYNELIETIEEFMIYLLESKKLIREEDKEEIYNLIKLVIKLTMTKPNIHGWFKRQWVKIKSKFNCL